MHGRIFSIMIALLLLTPLWASARQDSPPPSGTVEIHDRATVNSERVFLRHIARIDGFNAAEKERIGGIYVTYAPQPGEALSFSGERVRTLVTSYNAAVQVQSPEMVVITRGYRVLGRDQIRALFVDAVVRQGGFAPDRVKVTSLSPDEQIRIPEGNSRVLLEFSPGETFRRRATARLSVAVDQRHWKSFYITGNMELYGSAVTVTRAVKRGEKITAEDVTVQDVDLAKLPDSVVTDPRDAWDMEALSALKPGQVLTEGLVQAPVLVNRGDVVTLVLEAPNMTVTARGVAQQAGRRKQAIKVLNVASNKVVYGQVLSAREVRIVY